MNWNDWLALATLSLSFYFSWMYAIYTNDIFDVKIDLISNSHRPMPNGSLSLSEMRSVSLLFLVSALIGAYLSGYYASFAFFSSTRPRISIPFPPLRLKRVPLVSAFVVAICCLSTVMAGFLHVLFIKRDLGFPRRLDSRHRLRVLSGGAYERHQGRRGRPCRRRYDHTKHARSGLGRQGCRHASGLGLPHRPARCGEERYICRLYSGGGHYLLAGSQKTLCRTAHIHSMWALRDFLGSCLLRRILIKNQ